MRVICIKNFNLIHKHRPHPKFGDIDVVIDEGCIKEYGEYYVLERFGEDWGYCKSYFSPFTPEEEVELLQVSELIELKQIL